MFNPLSIYPNFPWADISDPIDPELLFTHSQGLVTYLSALLCHSVINTVGSESKVKFPLRQPVVSSPQRFCSTWHWLPHMLTDTISQTLLCVTRTPSNSLSFTPTNPLKHNERGLKPSDPSHQWLMDQAKPMADQPDGQTSCGRSKQDHCTQTKH